MPIVNPPLVTHKEFVEYAESNAANMADMYDEFSRIITDLLATVEQLKEDHATFAPMLVEHEQMIVDIKKQK